MGEGSRCGCREWVSWILGVSGLEGDVRGRAGKVAIWDRTAMTPKHWQQVIFAPTSVLSRRGRGGEKSWPGSRARTGIRMRGVEPQNRRRCLTDECMSHQGVLAPHPRYFAWLPRVHERSSCSASGVDWQLAQRLIMNSVVIRRCW
jgi:hypothetical protein